MASTLLNATIKGTQSREELTELLESLGTKTVFELQDMYNQFEGKAITTRNRPFLTKKLSAAIQEQLVQLEQKELEKPINSDHNVDSTAASSTSKSKRQRKRDPRLPPAGTILFREYRGTRHEVLVLDDGFTYNGKKYGSLSKIAKHIASGTSWNGFLFFRTSLLQASQNQSI